MISKFRKSENELVDSILNDIYNEQENARESRMWGRSGVNTLLPNLNYLSQRAMNYSITYPQMQENKVSLNLLIELLGSLRALADTAKSVWDSSWLPTSYFKRSRAVSTYMHKQIDSIFTSIFGRELSRWNRITRTDSKDEHSGKSRMNAARGSARHAADQEANKIARQRGKDKSFTPALSSNRGSPTTLRCCYLNQESCQGVILTNYWPSNGTPRESDRKPSRPSSQRDPTCLYRSPAARKQTVFTNNPKVCFRATCQNIEQHDDQPVRTASAKTSHTQVITCRQYPMV